MIVALMRTPSSIVSKKLRELGLIKICIDLFFAYPWNNLLHGSVEHIIQMVVSGECEILKKALFEDCDFLNRILEARALSAKHQKEKKFRLGYMGHITRVSNTIVEFAKRNEQLRNYMEENEQWMKFIGDDLKLENEQLNTQLGGHRPTALGDDDGDDFTLFTLNDITNTQDQDDLLGGNDYDDNPDDVDRDSDSDSDDDDDTAAKNGDAKGDDYEMPQDAFSRLTQTLDEVSQNDGQPVANKGKTEVTDANKAGGDDFDNWFNNDDSWTNFGNNDNNQQPNNSHGDKKEDDKPAENNATTTTEPKKEDTKKATNADDDFANWDNDPFADDIDLFGTDEPEDDKKKMKPTEVMTHDENENGLEIPDSLTPSPQPEDKDNKPVTLAKETTEEASNDNEDAKPKEPNGHKSKSEDLNGNKKEEPNGNNDQSQQEPQQKEEPKQKVEIKQSKSTPDTDTTIAGKKIDDVSTEQPKVVTVSDQ